MKPATVDFESEVAAYRAAHPEPEIVEVLTTDINGIIRGKQYPPSVLDKIGKAGVLFPITSILHDALGGIPQEVLRGWREGDPDSVFRPVPGSLVPVPWADRPTAQLLVAGYDREGEPERVDPRQTLARVLERYHAIGLRPVIAIELEFYLLSFKDGKPVPTAPEGPFPPLTGPQSMTMEALADYAPFVRRLEDCCRAQKVPLTSVLSEYGDGQLEANLEHGEALTASDQAMCLKRIVKSVARENGWLASFMAKPFAGMAGNGLHVHVSVLDEAGRNIFTKDERLRHAVGGLLETLTEQIALIAPNANSYRRFQEGFFVPTTGTWGENHRAVAIRLPLASGMARRLEHRIAGADACPYLVVAAVLAGMLHGLESAKEPTIAPIGEGEPLRGDGAPFPTRWKPAIEALAKAKVLPRYLSQEAIDVYVRTKRSEEERFNAEVSDRDYTWYLRVV